MDGSSGQASLGGFSLGRYMGTSSAELDSQTSAAAAEEESATNHLQHSRDQHGDTETDKRTQKEQTPAQGATDPAEDLMSSAGDRPEEHGHGAARKAGHLSQRVLVGAERTHDAARQVHEKAHDRCMDESSRSSSSRQENGPQ